LRNKYEHLSFKEIEDNPWGTVCVELTGPYIVTDKHDTKFTSQALTICDPETGWLEIAEIRDKSSEGTAKILDQTWLCTYPRPKRCIHENGNEFLGKEFQELLKSYAIKSFEKTVKNSEANFAECVH
jgi:hypothetical protein